MNPNNGPRGNESASDTLLAQAVFVVNKHAKTALEPKALYDLKRLALNKLLTEGRARKTGLHFSDNPRFSAQQSDVIVECGEYIFHLPPTKEDLKSLPHLGNRSSSIRNPKATVSLSRAKHILQTYIGHADSQSPKPGGRQPVSQAKGRQQKKYENPFPSTFLGKGFKW